MVDYYNESVEPLNFERNENSLIINDFLDFCQKKNYYITIKHYNGFEILGYILDISEETILLQTFNQDNGIYDGITALLINDVERESMFWE
ncbi:MAG: hypothetical protein LBE36_03280 [Flavobacteriaceae bacterium]|nr:hypothetical protein [Flavobacteriaceae bacterium]